MKRHLLILSLLTTSVVMAQQPEATFKRKLKTAPSTPGVAERLGAELRKPSSTSSARRSALVAGSGSLKLESVPLRIVRDASTNLPIFIERKISSRSAQKALKTNGARLSAEAAASTTFQFMSQVGSLLKVDKPETKFTIAHTEHDELGQTHVRLTQMHRGVPVLGAEMVAHLTNGEVTLLNGRYKTIAENLSTAPKLSLADASTRALADVKTISPVRSFGDNLLNLKQSVGKLYVFSADKEPAKLVYQVTVRPNMIERWEYIIDAQTGDVLDKFNHTCSFAGPTPASGKDLNGVARSFQTYQQDNAYYLIDASRSMFDKTKSVMPTKPVGAIVTVDAKNDKEDSSPINQYLIASKTNTDWNSTAVSAHYNAGVAYDYYKNTFNRNALDGDGGTMVSVINIADENGKGLDNAFWNGEFMGYGNGDKLFKPLAGGLDVAGHEMTHGVIEKTAGLVYQGQSGAMNESFADIFGAMIDRANWTVGEGIIANGSYKSGALRDLSNPNQGGKSLSDRGYQPATMAQYENLAKDKDNGGVHINSGISNFAYYTFATAIGKDKAEKVYYRALTTYLVRTSQFLDLRLAIIKSAGDLYGASGAEVTAAKAAFDAVGITEDTQTTPQQPDLPVASGEDLILLTDINKSQLYSTNMGITPTKFDQKTTTSLTHRPSVTDDGQTAYYVSSDKRIRSVNLTGTPSEFIVSNEAIWDNVAISKDGTKLAALTADRDTSIYVYSFVNKKWARFRLYNPTYSEGVQTSNVLFADSFEWDFSGQYLIYDAYNESGSSNYWDVSIIDVWDNQAGSFSDGYIERVFPNLDEGESIGNPSFSKNSPSIVAFDYVNENDNSYYIITADLNTGKAKLAYENNTLGFPNYSRTDDKLVFNHQTDGQEGVSGVLLDTDKLTVTSDVVDLYTGAKWPVWYTQTKRSLPKTTQTITFGAIADRYINQGAMTLQATSSSSLTVGFRVKSGPATVTGTSLKLTGMGTVTIQAYQDGNDQYSAATPVERSFSVLAVTSIEPTWADIMAVYPNPVSTSLTIELPGYETFNAVSLKTIGGATVLQPPLTPKQSAATLDIAHLPAGIYILQVQTASGITSRKVVKQ